MCGNTREEGEAKLSCPAGRARCPPTLTAVLFGAGGFLSYSVISERFDAGTGRGSPKQVRRLTRGQKKKREGGGENKGGEGAQVPAHRRPSQRRGWWWCHLGASIFGGSSFGQGTREDAPHGRWWAWCGRGVGVALASRVLLEPSCRVGRDWALGAQVCGFKMRGSRAVRAGHCIHVSTVGHGSDMGATWEGR